MCADETMMKWMAATLAGEKPNIDRVGLAYMLMGEARQGQTAAPAKEPTQVKEWFYIGPHVMVVLPDSATEALRGINQDLSSNQPYVTLINSTAGSTPLWVIPVAKSGERIKEELTKRGRGALWKKKRIPLAFKGSPLQLFRHNRVRSQI
jgi:hypothetical protein